MNNSIFDYFDNVCSSSGNFKDAPLSSSSLNINEAILYDIYNENENNSYLIWNSPNEYFSDILEQQYSSILKTEFQLKKLFKTYQIDTVYGMQCFLNNLMLIMQESENNKIYRLNDYKIIDILKKNIPFSVFSGLKRGESLNDAMKIFSAQNLFSLTRLFENKEWLLKSYKLYCELDATDFIIDNYNINVYNPVEYTKTLDLLISKNTLWEDKIGGTIFAIPFQKTSHFHKVPYFRTILRFIHYYYELQLNSLFISHVYNKENFGELFYNYLSEANFSNDFFEPHCLMESLIWEKTQKKFIYLFGDMLDDMWKQNTVIWNYNQGVELTNNFIDVVSNLSHDRSNKNENRITAMIIKKEIFERLVKGEDINSLLLKALITGKIIN